MKDEIPHRNTSPYGWWIATYVLRTSWDDEQVPSQKKLCLAWENTIILRADDRQAAYSKAVALGAQSESSFEDTTRQDRKGRWVFEGLTSLLPIYDKLEDGAEVLWVEHKNKTLGKVRSWIKQKEQLEVFDDTPACGDGV